ncbi:Integrase, catalytic core domain protein, partial [mine drainage metagenome]
TQEIPVNTITFDNGKEFASHEDIGDALNANIYFARPYHSWERGTNENTNVAQQTVLS